MSHSHEYRFWHAHGHWHECLEHDTGHYHVYAQMHEHGPKSSLTPHSHKAKQYHSETDEENEIHHHAPIDHKPLDYNVAEYHPECKLPYYGGGPKGCIDRCETGKEKEEQK